MPHRILTFQLHHFLLCDSALAAALFDALLVRPSLKVLDAALAAFAEVRFAGAFRWERALPAALFELLPVEPLFMVVDAFDAARLPVTLLFAITPSGLLMGSLVARTGFIPGEIDPLLR